MPSRRAKRGLGDAMLAANPGDIGGFIESEAARWFGPATADGFHLRDALEEFLEVFFFHGRSLFTLDCSTCCGFS